MHQMSIKIPKEVIIVLILLILIVYSFSIDNILFFDVSSIISSLLLIIYSKKCSIVFLKLLWEASGGGFSGGPLFEIFPKKYQKEMIKTERQYKNTIENWRYNRVAKVGQISAILVGVSILVPSALDFFCRVFHLFCSIL